MNAGDPPPLPGMDPPSSGTRTGWVNAHTHIYSGFAPLDMPPPTDPPKNFMEILERVWWRLDRALDATTLRASARYYVADALLSGTSSLIDHHESPNFIEGSLDILADVCQELGMRAVLCYGATERNGDREEARRGLAECRRFIESNDRPLIRGVIGLHASFTVSDDTIREAGELCRDLDTVLHIHMAEDSVDVNDARARGYDGPLERLVALDALPEGSILAHGVQLDPAGVRLAAKGQAWIVQNPRSNRGNGVGYPKFLSESYLVALGTDGYPADRDEEAEALLVEATAHGEPPEATRPRIDAGVDLAEALLDSDVTPSGPRLREDTATLVDGQVQRLVVAGREVVREGRLLTADVEDIRARARHEAGQLWRQMADLDTRG